MPLAAFDVAFRDVRKVALICVRTYIRRVHRAKSSRGQRGRGGSNHGQNPGECVECRHAGRGSGCGWAVCGERIIAGEEAGGRGRGLLFGNGHVRLVYKRIAKRRGLACQERTKWQGLSAHLIGNSRGTEMRDLEKATTPRTSGTPPFP